MDVLIEVFAPQKTRREREVSAGFSNVRSLTSQHLILYTAPRLSSGLSLSLKLVSSRRKVVIGLCATRIL